MDEEGEPCPLASKDEPLVAVSRCEEEPLVGNARPFAEAETSGEALMSCYRDWMESKKKMVVGGVKATRKPNKAVDRACDLPNVRNESHDFLPLPRHAFAPYSPPINIIKDPTTYLLKNSLASYLLRTIPSSLSEPSAIDTYLSIKLLTIPRCLAS